MIDAAYGFPMKTPFRAWRLLVLLVLALGVGGPAHAWNEQGHRVVALIAEGQLSPQAKQYFNSILSRHPSLDVRDLAAASCWPDQIRSNPALHHGEWHYNNLYLFSGVPERPLEVGGQALYALNRNTRLLKRSQTSEAERAIALCWIVHIVGDIHQPLHSTARINEDYPDGDRGGTLQMVRFGQLDINLHAFWDSAGGLFWGGANMDRLPSIVCELLRRLGPSDSADRERSPVAWREESFRLAGDAVYDEVPDGAPLSDEYIERARSVSEQRMTLAGYRLAAYLERIYLLQARSRSPRG